MNWVLEVKMSADDIRWKKLHQVEAGGDGFNLRKIAPHLPLSHEYLPFLLCTGHRDYQHGHSNRAHRGHSRQNGLYRDEWSRHRRLSLRPMQVLQWRHCKGTVNLISSVWIWEKMSLYKMWSLSCSTNTAQRRSISLKPSFSAAYLILGSCLRWNQQIEWCG